MDEIVIRCADAEMVPELVRVWERSVRASHAFLAESDIAEILPQAREALRSPGVWVAQNAGAAAGFMILDGSMVEALFVDVPFMGKGIGSKLLRHAREIVGRDTELRVDVNEQNPDALAFYLSKGFKQVGRSETDAVGRPFPILHLMMPKI